MSRRVKCQDTGEYSTSDCAYRATNGKYWSSEAAYQQWVENKEWRQKSVDALFEILGYQSGMTVPGVLWKNFAKYEKMGYETVYETIIGERKNIEWAMQNKEFKSEAGLISYVCRTLENHMMDYYKTIQAVKKAKEKQKNTQDNEDNNYSDAGLLSSKSHDVSQFLGDDEWI